MTTMTKHTYTCPYCDGTGKVTQYRAGGLIAHEPLTAEDIAHGQAVAAKFDAQEKAQVRIEAALVDIEEWRLYGVVNSEAIATRLEAILKGETS